MKVERSSKWLEVVRWLLVLLVGTGTLLQHYPLTFVALVAFMLLIPGQNRHLSVQVMRWTLLLGTLWLTFRHLQAPESLVPWFLLVLGLWTLSGAGTHPK